MIFLGEHVVPVCLEIPGAPNHFDVSTGLFAKAAILTGSLRVQAKYRRLQFCDKFLGARATEGEI